MKNLELNNHGERLVPGYSHDISEVIRHKSSYVFFKKIIESDFKKNNRPVRILEVGCGTGHGTSMLATIDDCKIFAIDIDSDAINFAKNHFPSNNIHYQVATLDEIPQEEIFDYIISRHSFEHIENIFVKILAHAPLCRLMVNVPYKEKVGNPFHFYDNIDESFFSDWPNVEFFYETLSGETFDSASTNDINSICGVATYDTNLTTVKDAILFPFKAWEPNYAEQLAYGVLPSIEAQLVKAQSEVADAQRMLSHPVIRAQRKLWRMLRFWK